MKLKFIKDDSESNKYRRCPHCKSKEGFEIVIFLGGNETKKMSFKGKILHTDRDGRDSIERYGSCLSCGKLIPSHRLDLNNV